MITRVRAVRVAMCLGLLLGSTPAMAQPEDHRFADQAADLAKTVGKRSLSRARRSLTLGPFVGAAPGVTIDDPEPELRLSFGLALLRYDVPILPSPNRIVDILKSRARERFAGELKRLAAGGREVTEQDKERLAEQIWSDIKAEFLLEHRPERFEKPSFAVLGEVDHQLSSGAWELGALVAIGVGPVFASIGPILHWDDGFDMYTGVEIAKPMLLSDGLRAPVVDMFVRADIATTGRDERTDRVFLGARLALDLL